MRTCDICTAVPENVMYTAGGHCLDLCAPCLDVLMAGHEIIDHRGFVFKLEGHVLTVRHVKVLAVQTKDYIKSVRASVEWANRWLGGKVEFVLFGKIKVGTVVEVGRKEKRGTACEEYYVVAELQDNFNTVRVKGAYQAFCLLSSSQLESRRELLHGSLADLDGSEI